MDGADLLLGGLKLDPVEEVYAELAELRAETAGDAVDGRQELLPLMHSTL